MSTNVPGVQPYVSPATLPGPYFREILDLVGEEAVEIAAELVSGDTDALSREVGDLIHVRRVAFEAGVLGIGTAAAESENADPVSLALAVAVRASKCRRFGMDEVQPGVGMSNGNRLSDAVATLLAAVLPMCGAGLVEAAATAKRLKLARFMQYGPDDARIT